MTKLFDRFMADLAALCKQHAVAISTDIDDGALQVFDSLEAPPLWFKRVDDCTAPGPEDNEVAP